MESVGTVHGLARETIGNDIRRLFDRAGPYVSVYVETDPEIENAAPTSVRHWRNVRDGLVEQEADEADIAAIDALVPDAHRHGSTLCVVATGGEVVLADHQPEPPKRDHGRYGALPYVAPLLEWRQASVPHVVVRTDRTGADIVAVRRWGDEKAIEVDAHGDESVPLSKSKPGGWSQPRYQRRVENAWEENAQEVADRVVDAVDSVDARIVIVAGDVRAVELLKSALPPQVVERLEEVSGGRSPDGSVDDVADDVIRLTSTRAAAETVELLQKFREEKGQQDRAADGAAATLAALTASQVETLLISDDPDDERTAFFDPDGTAVALDERTLRDFGVESPREGRLVDAAIRAAVVTGAGVWMVPSAGGPADGVGAILRWSGPS